MLPGVTDFFGRLWLDSSRLGVVYAANDDISVVHQC
jgi:hypothetical protein